MPIAYRSSAEQFTTRILAGLRAAGWADLADAADDDRREIEARILDLIEEAREAAGRGNARVVLALLFGDGYGGLNADGERFGAATGVEQYNGSPRRPAGLLLEAVATVAPDGRYDPPIPPNVVAALDAAYRAAVLPRRCYSAAARRIERLGATAGRQVALAVTDDDGTAVYDREEQGRSGDREAAFWAMFDAAIEQFGLRGAVGAVELGEGQRRERVLTRTLPSEAARLARRLAEIDSDRQGGG